MITPYKYGSTRILANTEHRGIDIKIGSLTISAIHDKHTLLPWQSTTMAQAQKIAGWLSRKSDSCRADQKIFDFMQHDMGLWFHKIPLKMYYIPTFYGFEQLLMNTVQSTL